MEEQKTELKMIRMSEVQSQEVKWLWYPFIPYGKLTIIQGDPGDGKTTLVLNIAARLSKGEHLDNDMNVQEPVNVIYQTAEDGLADTVKPRLELAGADCEKVLVIDESDKAIIKRVIGLPGETVEYKDNKLYINGKETEDPYPSTETDDFSITDIGHIKVPGDCYFVMGDNRANSLDSRYPTVGVIKKSQIEGRTKLRIWPLNKIGNVK